MTRKILLVCGIVSSLLYVAMNVFVPMRWEGYSSASQTVSELSAIGASTRPLWVPLGLAWPPMHLREVLAAGGGTLTDTMHIVFAMVTVVLMLLAMGFGAVAFGNRFRLYSIATMVILLACGALTVPDAANIQANLPTPWVGVWERINIGVFLLWVIVLATRLLSARDTAAVAGRQGARAA